MKIFLSILSACLAFHQLSAASLKVGMELAYPPFEMVSNEGKPYGISVEMANALGEYLDKEIVIENIPFVDLIPALNAGKIDLIISSMTITHERKKAIDFSDSYVTLGLGLLTNKQSSIKSVGDLNQPGKVVMVKEGTSGETYARLHLSKGTIKIMDQELKCVQEVRQGKADAFIYDQLAVYMHGQKNPETTRAILVPFQKEHWGVGIRKGNRELLVQINAFLKKFREEKKYDLLADKYLAEQRAAFQKLGIPFVF